MRITAKCRQIGAALVFVVREYPKFLLFWIFLGMSAYLSVSTWSPRPFLWFLVVLACWPFVLLVSVFGIRILVKVGGPLARKYLTDTTGQCEDSEEGREISRRYGYWPHQW